MGHPARNTHEYPAEKGLTILGEVLGSLSPRDFAVRLWDGSVWTEASGQPRRFTLVLNHPGALRTLLGSRSELSLGEGYVAGDFDVEGDIGSAFRLAEHLLGLHAGPVASFRLARRLLAVPARGRPRGGRPVGSLPGALHSRERDRRAVAFHYDVSNDFYRLWLDERMVYSCAYFLSDTDGLEVAQERKLDYICRKLRLHPGERVLDIGCGWGGLVLHAALRYGAQAVGVTVSRPQADFAEERVRRAGASDRCRIEVRDYRDLEDLGPFDKLVSVGMSEHVGDGTMAEYFRCAFSALRPGGVFLNHAIARNPSFAPMAGPSFSDRYVFPDGDLVPLGALLRHAERCGFEVRDVENLREHYVMTLRHWVRRLELRRDEAVQSAGERVFRIWRLYMAGAAHKFREGRNNVFQVLLSKLADGRSGLPLTRSDWYETR
jgi:cyclopropane-fatty-acyl-phospholipid synthase